MTHPSDNTQPKLKTVDTTDDLQAPPRFLLWAVIGLFLLFIAGVATGLFIFNSVLTSGQQARVMGVAPFMESFLVRQPTPSGGVLPTAPPGDDDAAMDLLNMPVEDDVTATPVGSSSADDATNNTTEAPTATMPPTATPVPPTATPQPSPTPIPATATPQPEAQSQTNTSAVASVNQSSAPQRVSLPTQARMYGFDWARQTWNNCGPATITTALSYFGWEEDQEYAKERLRPNREDKNVSPDELVNFVNTQSGINAIARMGGDLTTLRALIANEIPVVIERGIRFEANDWLGHYQTLVAYDNNSGVFYAYDSFLGQSNGEGVSQRFTTLDDDWRAFNRTFIVLYTDAQQPTVERILGDKWDAEAAAQAALEVATQEARANPQDGFAWHNMGTSLVELGRYREAATAFDRARQAGLPWRMLWYQFGIFEAYHEVGRYSDIISLAQSNINQAAELEESYYWLGKAYAAQGDTSQAASEFRTALRYNPNYAAAQTALDNL